MLLRILKIFACLLQNPKIPGLFYLIESDFNQVTTNITRIVEWGYIDGEPVSGRVLETTGHKSRRRSTSFGFLVFPQTRPNPSWAACNWARKATLHFLISATAVGLSANGIAIETAN